MVIEISSTNDVNDDIYVCTPENMDAEIIQPDIVVDDEDNDNEEASENDDAKETKKDAKQAEEEVSGQKEPDNKKDGVSMRKMRSTRRSDLMRELWWWR